MNLDSTTGPISAFVGVMFSLVTGALACYFAYLLGYEPISQVILIVFAAGLTLLQISFAHDALTITHAGRYVFGVAAIVLLCLSVGTTATVLETLYQNKISMDAQKNMRYQQALAKYNTADGLVRYHEQEAKKYREMEWPKNEAKHQTKVESYTSERSTAKAGMDALRPAVSIAGLGSLSDDQRWSLWVALGTLVDVVRSLAFWLASIKATVQEHRDGSETGVQTRRPEAEKINPMPSSPRPGWMSLFEDGERITPTALKKRQHSGYNKARDQITQAALDGWLVEKDGQYLKEDSIK